MASVLLVYGTSEGQTEKIAHHVAGVLVGRGHEVELVHGRHLPESLAPARYDAVVVGDSVHGGRHHAYVRRWVEANRDVLASRPSGFFQVSLSAASERSESVAASRALVDEFLEGADWSPDHVGDFGGALVYSQYGPVQRFVLKRIAGREGGDTDTARDYEYTDWGEVTAFAEAVAADLDDVRHT